MNQPKFYSRSKVLENFVLTFPSKVPNDVACCSLLHLGKANIESHQTTDKQSTAETSNHSTIPTLIGVKFPIILEDIVFEKRARRGFKASFHCTINKLEHQNDSVLLPLNSNIPSVLTQVKAVSSLYFQLFTSLHHCRKSQR